MSQRQGCLQRRLDVRHDPHVRTGRRQGRTPRGREIGGGQRPGQVQGRAHDRRAGQRVAARHRVDDRTDILVAHRGPEQRHRRRWRPVAARQVGTQVCQRPGEGRSSAGVVRTVEEHLARGPAAARRRHDQLETARPAGSRVAPSPGGPVAGRDPRLIEGVEQGVRNGDVRRLVASPEPDLHRAQPWQIHGDPVTRQAQERRRERHRKRHAQASAPAPHDRQRLAVGSGHGHVAAIDDGGLLAGDVPDRRPQPVHVVEPDVGQHRDPPVPGVGGVEPAPQADLDQGQVE